MNYSIANGQALTKYRAIKLVRPTTDYSGRYSCEVSSLFSQDSKAKTMLVYGEYFLPNNEKKWEDKFCFRDK